MTPSFSFICSMQAKKSAPMRSSLLMKAMRGTRCLLAWYQTVSHCTSTPPTAQKTPTAPSRTRRERSTSAVKSTWPGVSMMCDLRVAPVDGDGGAVDGDALGLFERVEVGGGVAVVDVADLVLGAAEVEDALGRRGFARVDVGDDADVAKFFEHGYTAADFAAAPETRTKIGSDPTTRKGDGENASPTLSETNSPVWVP